MSDKKIHHREHGTYAKYAREGCKCSPCVEAMRAMRRKHVKLTILGQSPTVPADRSRAQVERLIAEGMTFALIEHASGVDRTSIRRLVGAIPGRPGRSKRVRRETERALLAVRPSFAIPRAGLIDSTGTRRRIEALVTFGYPKYQLAGMLGAQYGGNTLQACKGGVVLASTARKVAVLFGELQVTPGPSDRARSIGRSKGWALPFEWDEDSIDDPNAKPASGARWNSASAREERVEQVLELTRQGRTAAEIADKFSVSQRQIVRDRGHAVSA